MPDPKTKSATPPILVPVDFSEHSRAALLWACDQGKRLDKPVIVLHVVNDPYSAPGYYKTDDKDVLKPMEEVAERMMRQFLKESGKAFGDKKHVKAFATELVTGLPVTRILEVADRTGTDHIVMGSQGRTGLKRLLIGSKAEQVLRIADVPVTIVKTKKKK